MLELNGQDVGQFDAKKPLDSEGSDQAVYDTPEQMIGQFYGPLIRVWSERVRQAENAKVRFTKIGKVCNDFYESERGFMWQDESYFNGRMPRPRFAITIAKAFEFVSIYAPHLYWQDANRKVFSQRKLKLIPELFGDPRDEQAQQFGQQVMMAEQKERVVQQFGNDMMSIYLNWCQREQPGSMIVNGQGAIIEALIKGMGLLWAKTYQFPESDDIYTMQHQGSVDDLLIDPDCTDSRWETAGYIMCRHKTPIWQVEKMFDLPRGSLHGKGSYASSELRAQQGQNNQDSNPQTFDCIEWYECWSKCGIGPRSHQLNHQMIDSFDESLGDNVYLAFAPGVPYPLNAPAEKFYGEDALSPEMMKPYFEWRCHGFGDVFPVYKDRRWPVEPLSFNPIPGSPYPLAPLAPGLGELIAINVLTSSYVDTAWSNRQQILAYVQSAVDEIKEVLDSDDAIAKVPLNDNLRGHINDAMQFLNRPPANTDQLQAIQILSENFNRRVGLNELQYGETRTQIRVSGDVRAKQEALQIRPQKMASDVARWLSNASQKEMFLAAMHVRGASLRHLLGDWGSQQWDAIFGRMDVDELMRECRATVEASEVARPSKERDTANFQSMQQYLLPMLQQYAQQTGNTEPLNEFMERLGEAMDMAEAPVQLPDWKPPVDEEQQKMQQMLQEIEMQKTQAEIAAKQASAEKTMVDAGLSKANTQKAMVDAGLGQANAQKTAVDTGKSMAETQRIMTETAISTAEHQLSATERQVPQAILGELDHQSDLRRKDESHMQDMEHKQQDHILDLFFTTQKGNAESQNQKIASKNGNDK